MSYPLFPPFHPLPKVVIRFTILVWKKGITQDGVCVLSENNPMASLKEYTKTSGFTLMRKPHTIFSSHSFLSSAPCKKIGPSSLADARALCSDTLSF
ncbi:MAG: hypothetical protein K0R08_825 [Solimicrobium sp.]|jgi:hypothetical protein|nr:hypothetical protein [Solimicrobium sp.]